MEGISGGNDVVSGFCNGFAIASGAYYLGALANFWNPIGAGAATAITVISIGCALAS